MKKTIIALMACIFLFSCIANASMCDNGVQVLSSVEGDDAPLDIFVVSIVFIIALFVCLLLFLFSREVVCWYFKINKIVSLLEELNDNVYDMRRNKKVDFDENKNQYI